MSVRAFIQLQDGGGNTQYFPSPPARELGHALPKLRRCSSVECAASAVFIFSVVAHDSLKHFHFVSLIQSAEALIVSQKHRLDSMRWKHIALFHMRIELIRRVDRNRHVVCV